jgi:Tfp pilus assembly protein PilV
MSKKTQNLDFPEFPRPTQRNERGFTLIETSISFVILMIVGLGAASLFAFAASNTSTANDRQLAMAVGQQKIEELRALLFTDSSLTATVGTDTNVTSAGRPYLVKTVITDSNVVNGEPTLKKISVRVVPLAATQRWATTVASLFGSVTLTTERSTLLLGPNR